MAKINDGMRAFPRLTRDAFQHEFGGMSLRDYFAGQALMGLIASNDHEAGDRIEELPEYSYWIADAMLKARGDEDA